jgi:hypothetical protein
VYAFYDPELSELELGKVTALWEIQFVQSVRAHVSPRFKFYYMGYYVHSCPKMRYKAEYAPSDLRCPVTGAWVPLTAESGVLAKLDADHRGALADDATAAAHRAQAGARAAAMAAAIPSVPLLVGGTTADALCRVRDLTEKGRRVVADALKDLLARTGAALGGRIIVHFR